MPVASFAQKRVAGRAHATRRLTIALVVLACGALAWPVLGRFTKHPGETLVLLMPPALAALLWFGWPRVRRIPLRKYALYPVVLAPILAGAVYFVSSIAGGRLLWIEVFWALYFTVALRLAWTAWSWTAGRVGERWRRWGRRQRRRLRNGVGSHRTLATATRLIAPARMVLTLLVFVPLACGLLIHRIKIGNPVGGEAYSGIPVEEVTFRTADGLNLSAWFVAEPGSDATVVICHGAGANKSNFLMFTRLFRFRGYNSLIFDFRGHGASDGHTCTFGLFEDADVTAAVDWLKAHRPDQARHVYAIGSSMGAMALARAAAEDERIEAVILDSCFASAPLLVRQHLGRVPLIGSPMALLIAASASLHAGESLWQLDARGAVAEIAPRPVLLIHGSDDTLIPPVNLDILYEHARQPRDKWLGPGPHSNVLTTDFAGYQQRVLAFLDRARPGPATQEVPRPMDKRTTIRRQARLLKDLPGQQLPEATPELLEQAERIAGGTVFFYFTTPVEVGLKDIDWTGSHIKHQEWPAQLNRFFHLRPLAAAYAKTGDERFAEAARAYIEDWIRGDPYADTPKPRAGDNTLNISIRLGSSTFAGWAGTLPCFLDSPAFDDEFLDRMLASIDRQALWLSRHLSPVGNWRISQLDALVMTSMRLPFLPSSEEIRRIGLAGLRSALATQFLPDGVHIERTPGYHDWMTNVAACYLQIAQLPGGVDAGVDAARVMRACDYAAQSDLFGVNDSTAPHRDPDELRGPAFRRELLARLHRPLDPPPREQVFADAGQVFIRSGWTPSSDYLAFDASTWGGAHSHLSRLSFAFRAGGRMLVADPGILNYEMSDPLAAYGKSTAAHSTLNLNGWNQSGADADLLRTALTPQIALIHARYQGGYWEGRFTWGFDKGRGRGVYGSHDRILCWIRGQYILVLDSMAADPDSQVQNVWQMGPMDAGAAASEDLAWWSCNQDANLLVRMVLAPADTTMECHEGRKDPPAGWVGWHGHDAKAAPQVVFHYPAGRGPTPSAVLLAPFAGKDVPAYKVLASSQSADGSVRHLQIQGPSGQIDHVAWSTGLAVPIDAVGPLETDALFAWYRTDGSGKPASGYVLDGSCLRYNGRQIWQAPQRQSQALSWPDRDGGTKEP